MRADLSDFREPEPAPTPDPLGDFAGFAFDAIKGLQRQVKELQAELDDKDRDLDLADARVEALLAILDVLS